MTSAPSLGVLQLVRNLDIGGAQEVVLTLAKELREAGHRPVVCSLRDGPLRGDIEASGVPVELVPERRHSVLALPLFLGEMRRIRRTLAAIVDRHEIDVVQTHLLRSLDFVAATLSRGPRRPVVYWTIHNSNFTLRREHLARHGWLLKPKQVGFRWLYRIFAARVSHVIAVSDEVRASVIDNIGLARRIVVIPNGVDVDRYRRSADRASLRTELGVPGEGPVMVMVGTFKQQKGHAFLIDATADVIADRPDARLLLIGDGDLRAETEQRVHERGLDGAVRFLGSRRDVPAILGVADCFVLPSLWEGLPMALLEAMAAELPCIATAVSGTSQVVVPGETGFLVPPGDAAALASTMRTMLADEDLRRAMGASARRRVEHEFSARKQAMDHVALFEADRAGR